MKPSEATVLLGVIARTDKRTSSEAEARAWAEAMTSRNINLDDAIAAVREHVATSTEYITPAHVIAKAKEISRARWVQAGDPPIPGGLTWAEEKTFRTIWCDHVKAGSSPRQAELLARQQMNIDPDPAVPKAVAEQRRAQVEKLSTTKAIPTREQR